jgi:uncharacterized membrane protein
MNSYLMLFLLLSKFLCSIDGLFFFLLTDACSQVTRRVKLHVVFALFIHLLFPMESITVVDCLAIPYYMEM